MEGKSVGLEIIDRVAELEGIDPVDIDARLQDVIDVDALDALVLPGVNGQAPRALHITFTYFGYDITVNDHGIESIVESSE